MAFGELDCQKDKEIASVRDANVFNQYDMIRKDLVVARDIPDHQLSNDRLRHAILQQGLNKVQTDSESGTVWIWNTLGIGATTAVIALLFVRHQAMVQPATAPKINLERAEAVASKSFQFDTRPLSLPLAPSPSILSKVPEVSVVANYRVAETATREVKHAHRRPRILNDPNVNPNWEALQLGGNGPATSDAPNAGANQGVHAESGSGFGDGRSPVSTASYNPSQYSTKRSGSESLVEIEQDQDDETGARAAREIASKNFVVGG
jgi:hypothetical protein